MSADRSVDLVRAGVIVACSLIAWPAIARQAQFQSTTDLVRVYATVKDDNGHLIADLRQDEFDLRDRGTRTPLTVFSTDPQPIAVAVLVDMSGALFERRTYELLQSGLTAFVDRLGPQDRARVGWFTKHEVALGPELTSDRDALKATVMSEIRLERVHPNVPPGDSVLTLAWAGRPLWNAIAQRHSVHGEGTGPQGRPRADERTEHADARRLCPVSRKSRRRSPPTST